MRARVGAQGLGEGLPVAHIGRDCRVWRLVEMRLLVSHECLVVARLRPARKIWGVKVGWIVERILIIRKRHVYEVKSER